MSATTYDPVRYAIISPARWGRRLLDAARGSSKLALVGVASRDAANAADIVQTYGGRAFPSFEAVLADAEVEAVLLPTPHFLHHPQALAALGAGKHVLVEKPIANSVAEAEEMQRAAEERGLVLAVGHQGRRAGGIRRAKQMLQDGELGQVAFAVAVHGFPLAPNYTQDDWETQPDKMPGGPLDQLAVHYMDMLQYLLGPIRRVAGFTASHLSPFAIPDAATATFEFEGGALGMYATHMVSAYASQMTLYGTRGALHINRFGQELFWQDTADARHAQTSGLMLKPIPVDGPSPYTTGLTEELEEFADCIRLGGRPEVGASEGIAALRVVRAIMEASATGQTVVLEN